jgi:hypothetical protein
MGEQCHTILLHWRAILPSYHLVCRSSSPQNQNQSYRVTLDVPDFSASRVSGVNGLLFKSHFTLHAAQALATTRKNLAPFGQK